MTTLSIEEIAIDTNVFLHLLHQGTDDHATTVNLNSHIDDLLDCLQEQNVGLLLDNKNKIAAEYLEYVRPLFGNDETDTKRYALKYWMQDCPLSEIPVDLKGRLYSAIKGVIHERGENCDRMFVFVAFASGNLLITNDATHILFGPSAEGNTNTNNRYTRLTAC